MINNNEDVLNINAFTKLLRPLKTLLSNFENHKTLFLYGLYFSI